QQLVAGGVLLGGGALGGLARRERCGRRPGSELRVGDPLGGAGRPLERGQRQGAQRLHVGDQLVRLVEVVVRRVQELHLQVVPVVLRVVRDVALRVGRAVPRWRSPTGGGALGGIQLVLDEALLVGGRERRAGVLIDGAAQGPRGSALLRHVGELV